MSSPIPVYSIGYRGLQPATFWAMLEGHRVEVLVDIRPAPRRAFMWGTSALRRGAESRNILYQQAYTIGATFAADGAEQSLADLAKLARQRVVALMGVEPIHHQSLRRRLIEAANALSSGAPFTAVPIYFRPMQLPLFSPTEGLRRTDHLRGPPQAL